MQIQRVVTWLDLLAFIAWHSPTGPDRAITHRSERVAAVSPSAEVAQACATDPAYHQRCALVHETLARPRLVTSSKAYSLSSASLTRGNSLTIDREPARRVHSLHANDKAQVRPVVAQPSHKRKSSRRSNAWQLVQRCLLHAITQCQPSPHKRYASSSPHLPVELYDLQNRAVR